MSETPRTTPHPKRLDRADWLAWARTIEGISKVEPDHSLARWTTLRIGGPAEVALVANDAPALSAILRRCDEHQVPLWMFGQGANVLVPDEGLPGVALRLAGEFKTVEIDGTKVRAGAAVPVPLLARQTVRAGLSGLEPLGGFPASVGGAVVMNAGCYGTEVIELLEQVRVLLPDGEICEFGPGELDAAYRWTNLRNRRLVVIDALFALREGDRTRGEKRLEELNERRWASLPSGKPNAGSTFKNPPGDAAGRLLEAAGFKGRSRGDAALSEKHANVVVNLGSATACDVVDLMAEACCAVEERFEIRLEPELLLLASLAERFENRRAGLLSGRT